MEKEGKTISDGYHTFDELYEFRMLYNAALFNEWGKYTVSTDNELHTPLYNVHKSWRHSDGELAFGGGWFIVVAELPTGQISNHYPSKDWDFFNIPKRETAIEFDGHTHIDVASRLNNFLKMQNGRR